MQVGFSKISYCTVTVAVDEATSVVSVEQVAVNTVVVASGFVVVAPFTPLAMIAPLGSEMAQFIVPLLDHESSVVLPEEMVVCFALMVTADG